MKNYQFNKSQKCYFFWKRLIDICGAFFGIIFCSLLIWWWVALLIKLTSKGPALFRQERVGKHKKTFKIFKFRTMRTDAPEIAPSDITIEQQKAAEFKFGSFLRKFSIDETVQIINILCGEMSFVGPRPGAAKNEEELIRFREFYTPSAYEVKPGISGLAQVKMNRDHNPKEKARFDSEYVENISFWLDVQLFLMTILIIKGK
ncbi:MAG: sugar transferase [Bacilli bacterium]|nr:sugar transferase [Bacilli bacterium]